MRRRELFAAVAALALVGCAGTQVRNESLAAADPRAFTTEGVEERLAGAVTFEDVARAYGPCDRREIDRESRPDQHECVWEFRAVRPSFAVVESDRKYMKTAVTKSLHVWFDARNRITAHQLTGESRVEVLRPPLPKLVMGVRPLSAAELAGVAIPAAAGESTAEVAAWNAAHAA